MAFWILDQWDDGPLDYPTLGFVADPDDILEAAAAPDGRWSSTGAGPETVTRYTLGVDPSYVEPGDGHVLTWSDVDNTYVPTAADVFLGEGRLDAAAAAAVDDALDTSPRIPEFADLEDYLQATVTPSGRLAHGTRTDGTHEVPALRQGEAVSVVDDLAGYVQAVTSPDGRVLFGVSDRGGITAGLRKLGCETIDVVILAGQSNATKRSTQPAAVAAYNPLVLEWNVAAQRITVASPDDVQWLGNEFARQYVRDNPERAVLIVPCAVGSSGFTSTSITPAPAGYHYRDGVGTWDRTLDADPINLYDKMITESLAAFAAAGDGARFAALLWSQGEDDRGPQDDGADGLTESQYAAKLDDLITTARTALDSSSLPVIIGSMTPQIVRENSPTATAGIAAALRDTPRRVQRTAYCEGPDDATEFEQNIHYSPQGQSLRGRIFATEGLARAKQNLSTASPTMPTGLKVTKSGTTVRVEWEPSVARVTAYTLQTSINGDGWTTQTLAGPIVTSYDHTLASASDTIRVRVSATNEVGTTTYTREVAA